MEEPTALTKNRTVLASAALFMIYLALSLTFFSALSTRAEAVFDVRVTGASQVPSFRGLNDTTVLTVFADSNMVNLLGQSGVLNLTCVNATGGYLCTYSFPQSYKNPGRYQLNLQQQGGTPPTTTATFFVDGRAPDFTVADIRQLGGSMTATYAVKDASSMTTADCSGLATVQLVVNDNVVATQDYEGGCEASGILTGETPGLQGPTKMYLRATDKIGNTATTPVQTRDIDTVPPALPSSFSLQRNGEEVMLISSDTPTTTPVTLSFTISELRLATITVDSSSLTKDPSLRSSYRTLTPACALTNDIYVCTVPNLRLNPRDATVNLSITAVDASGNRAQGVAYKTLTIQNARPTVTYLGRKEPRCDQCFLTTGANELLAVVEAPGGMRGAGLLFKADALMFAARNCTNTAGTTWECTATFQAPGGANGAQKTIIILASSMDDLGNPVDGILEKSFTTDNGKPRILEQPKADAACPTAGQQLHITTRVHDDNSPSLNFYGNVSQVTDRDVVSAPCTAEGNGDFTCILIIDSFFSTSTMGTVPMWIVDEAGNRLEMRMELEVCEAATDATPNYIRSLTPVGQLPVVDKRIASLIPFRVMVPLKLTISGARVIQVRSVTCDNPFMLRSPAYVVNEFSSSPTLVAYYKYEGAWPNSTVPLNCTLDFVIRKGNTVYIKPEKENLSLELPVTRQELGNPTTATRQKVIGLAQEINSLQDKIDGKAKIDKTLGTICTYAENMGKVNTALAAVKTIIYGISMVLIGTGIGTAAGKALWKAADMGLSKFHEIVNTYVWPPGWIPTGDPMQAIGYFLKYVCAIYTCKLYQMGTWSSFGAEAAMQSNLFKGAMQYEKLGVQATPEPSRSGGDQKSEKAKTVTNAATQSGGAQPGEERYQGYGGSGPTAGPVTTPAAGPPQTYSTTVNSPDNFVVNKKGDVISTDSSWYKIESAKPGFKHSEWQSMSDRQTQFSQSVSGELNQNIFNNDWIVNPYTNAPYDGLCFPAQLYNLRKEKQLKCIQLKCIDELAKKGLPITQCDEKFSTQHCLYVEGAQSRLHSNLLADRLLAAVGQIILQMSISLGMVLGFRYACPSLFSITAMGSAPSAHDNCMGPADVGQQSTSSQAEQCGWRSAACGLIGVAISLPEILNMIDNPWNKWNTVPTGQDYCDGLSAFNVTKDDSA